MVNYEKDKFDAYDKTWSAKWKPVAGADRFFVSCSGQLPVLCRINTATVEGQTRYGVVVQYPTKFLSFPLRDLSPMIKALQDLEHLNDSMCLASREPEETMM